MNASRLNAFVKTVCNATRSASLVQLVPTQTFPNPRRTRSTSSGYATTSGDGSLLTRQDDLCLLEEWYQLAASIMAVRSAYQCLPDPGTL